MTVLWHHIAVALSASALGFAGWRLALLADPTGPLRVVGAASVAAALAVAESLVLGFTGIGMGPGALASAAVLTALAVGATCPPARPGPATEFLGWWAGATPAARVALGAGAGAVMVWLAWSVREPALGGDMVLYHLPVAIAAVQDGDPGGVPGVIDALPVGAYPSVQEVLFAWCAGLSRGLTGFSVLPVLLLALTALAVYSGARQMRVRPSVAALAALASILAPQALGWQFTGAVTDVGALCWVACSAALCAGARRRPEVLALALVAGGLAVGTKTTALPPVALLIALTAAGMPRARVLGARVIAAGAVLALLVGGYWYVRNLIRYGSPLWPFYAAPWGEDVPRALRDVPVFIDSPRESLRWLSREHFSHFGGPLLLFAGAAAAALAVRGREVVVLAGTALLTVVLWTNAPVTGVEGPAPLRAMSTVRYLIPAAALAAGALALASRRDRRTRALVTVFLALVVGVEVVQGQTELGRPAVVPLHVLALGAAGGAVAVAGLLRFHLARRHLAFGGAFALLAIAVGLAAGASGYQERHARLGGAQTNLIRWLDERHSYRGTHAAVEGVGLRPGMLVGSEFEHQVGFIPSRTSCPETRARTRGAFIVVFDWRPAPGSRTRPERCLGDRTLGYSEGNFRIYPP